MKDFNFQLFGVLRGSALRFDGSPLLFLTFYSNLSGLGVLVFLVLAMLSSFNSSPVPVSAVKRCPINPVHSYPILSNLVQFCSILSNHCLILLYMQTLSHNKIISVFNIFSIVQFKNNGCISQM